MSQKIVECVPNFSEGRDLSKIKEITSEIEKVAGVKLLDVDPGADTNRTVVTFVGDPDSVAEAAFLCAKKASEIIDMTSHQGAHARFGATDVMPFIPVKNITMEECVEIAKKVAKRIGEELKYPVYLYEHAASKPEWKNLAIVRSGEYEGLSDKLKDDYWKPDFGPAQFVPKTGATAVSAREFLIAYNINLNTADKSYANDIAFNLREKGRSKRAGNIDPFYQKGEIVRYQEGSYPCSSCDFVANSIDELKTHYQLVHDIKFSDYLKDFGQNEKKLIGKPVKVYGKFQECKAIGWIIDEYNRAQISINFTNYKVTPPHIVVEEARKEAYKRGIVVTGSELVGLIPYDAIIQAGEFYLDMQDRSKGIPWQDIVETAVQSLGLRDVSGFDIEKDIIGIPETPGPLSAMTLDAFANEVSRESVAPGGGSIAAYAGAIGAALGNMVSNITLTKTDYENVHSELHEIAIEMQKIKDELVLAVDRDTNAFNDVMEANRLPKNTKEEKEVRNIAIEKGYQKATMVPFRTAELSFRALELCKIVAEKGNINSVSDAGVGALSAETGVIGGVMNVMINLPSITDQDFKQSMKSKLDKMLADAKALKEETLKIVYSKIEELSK